MMIAVVRSGIDPDSNDVQLSDATFALVMTQSLSSRTYVSAIAFAMPTLLATGT